MDAAVVNDLHVILPHVKKGNGQDEGDYKDTHSYA